LSHFEGHRVNLANVRVVRLACTRPFAHDRSSMRGVIG
jgi:hypothetical protein